MKDRTQADAVKIKATLKLNRYSRSLSGSAFQSDLRFMVGCRVLDNGKSQTGTAGCFGMALIHPVEPFEDPVFMFCGNADAGIPDNQTVVSSAKWIRLLLTFQKTTLVLMERD